MHCNFTWIGIIMYSIILVFVTDYHLSQWIGATFTCTCTCTVHGQYMDKFEFEALPCFISVCNVGQEPDGVSVVPEIGQLKVATHKVLMAHKPLPLLLN